MNFYDEERIKEMREKKLVEQNGKCFACGKYFKYGDKIELAHILKQGVYTESKYSEEIIHHPLNLKLSHNGKCNSDVQMNTNQTELVNAHVNMIKEAIKESKC